MYQPQQFDIATPYRPHPKYPTRDKSPAQKIKISDRTTTTTKLNKTIPTFLSMQRQLHNTIKNA